MKDRCQSSKYAVMPAPIFRRGQRCRLAKVVGDELGERLLAPYRALLQPPSGRAVQPRAGRSRERPIGHLTNENVSERVTIGPRRPDQISFDLDSYYVTDLAVPHWDWRRGGKTWAGFREVGQEPSGYRLTS